MKLAIFGDSYGFKNSSSSWPALLQKHFDVDHYAESGTSVWFSFKKFIKNYKNYTHIIYCYTNPNRIHFLPDNLKKYSYLLGPVPNSIDYIPKDIFNQLCVVWNAYQHLHDEELDLFISQKVFDDVNQLCRMENINLVNILPYEGIDYHFDPLILSKMTGSCILGLRYISENETGANLLGTDSRPCHMSSYNNTVLKDLILDSFFKNTSVVINAKHLGLFKLDEI